MSDAGKSVIRKILGSMFVTVGLSMLLADAHVAYVTKAAAHGINVGVSLVLCYGGMRLLMPAVAKAFAKEVSGYIPVLSTLLPGGRRASDPPKDTP